VVRYDPEIVDEKSKKKKKIIENTTENP